MRSASPIVVPRAGPNAITPPLLTTASARLLERYAVIISLPPAPWFLNRSTIVWLEGIPRFYTLASLAAAMLVLRLARSMSASVLLNRTWSVVRSSLPSAS